jgi:hypothetical protein
MARKKIMFKDAINEAMRLEMERRLGRYRAGA